MTTSEQSSETTEPQTMEEIEAEIEATREQLGATVDELSHRLDVKGRASDKVSDMKVAAQEKAADVKSTVHDKTVAVGAHLSDAGAQVKPLAQRREVQVAAGGALLLGVGAAIMKRRNR